MQFGVFLTIPSPDDDQTAQALYARAFAIAEEAEALGFSKLWLAEHHFTNYATSARPLQLLSHLAARTQQIRLGPAIIPIPLHHPLVVAEELATLDVLSGGRLEVGLGKGYAQYQYDRLGIDRARDQGRFLEALDVLQGALSQPLFHYEGKEFRVPKTRLVPQPIQRPPPVWLVVNTTEEQTVAQATQRGWNLFTGVLEPISRMTNPRLAWPHLFQDGGPALQVGTQRPVYVAETEAEARAMVEHVRWNARISVALRHRFEAVQDGIMVEQPLPWEPDTDTILDDFVVIGTPETCIRQLRRIQEGVGATYFSCSFWFGRLDQAAVLRSMRRFARDVAPAFR
jgi:alkanesulfonate monooxygenase SsuD/methylene tetrahydromethanopterin reductase-like flavin-dependent oxidoreductase (luciferase family)